MAANRRGVLNSSIAAQAQQAAVLDHVIPLAEKEADRRFNLQSMQEEFRQRGLASEQEFLHEVQLMDKRIGSEKELARFDAKTRKQLLKMEQKMRKQLANIEIKAEEKKELRELITANHQLYQESFRSILSNPDLSASERKALITAAQNNLVRRTRMARSLFKGHKIKWPNKIKKIPPSEPSGPFNPNQQNQQLGLSSGGGTSAPIGPPPAGLTKKQRRRWRRRQRRRQRQANTVSRR